MFKVIARMHELSKAVNFSSFYGRNATLFPATVMYDCICTKSSHSEPTFVFLGQMKCLPLITLIPHSRGTIMPVSCI